MTDIKDFATADACAEALARDMGALCADAVAARGRATLALSGGRTPILVYPHFAALKLPWKKIVLTLSDDRWVAPERADSNEGLVRRTILATAPATFVGLKTVAKTPGEGLVECESRLAALSWPLDGAFLGFGEDGHVASLFPDDPDWRRTRGRAVAVEAAARGSRISLSLRALLDCRRILIVAVGAAKARVLDAAQHDADSDLPLAAVLRQGRVPVTVYKAS